MELLFGVIVGLFVCLLGLICRLDKDKSFYVTVLMAITTYWVLYAVISEDIKVILIEVAFASIFSILGVLFFRASGYYIGLLILAHGVYDLSHDFIFINPGMPYWHPEFCFYADVVIGFWLIILTRYRELSANNSLKTDEENL